MIWAVLRHWRAIATVVIVCGLFCAGWASRGYVEGVADLRAQNASLEAALSDAFEAANVMRAHNARLGKEVAAQTALMVKLKALGGHDAPLSDLLAAAAAGLWP